MFTYTNQPQSSGKVIADSIKLYKHSFRKMWSWELMFSVWAISLPGIFTSFIGVFGTCLMFYMVHTIAMQNAIHINTALTVAIRKFLPLIGAFVLFILIFSLITGVIYGVLHAVGVSDYTAIIILIVVIGPFLIFFGLPLCYFYTPSLVLDDLSLFRAFKQTCTLIWGCWWRTFWVMLIGILPAILSYLLFVGLIFIADTYLKSGILQDVTEYATLGLFYVGFALLVLFVRCAVLVQFNDMKMRHGLREG